MLANSMETRKLGLLCAIIRPIEFNLICDGVTQLERRDQVDLIGYHLNRYYDDHKTSCN